MHQSLEISTPVCSAPRGIFLSGGRSMLRDLCSIAALPVIALVLAFNLGFARGAQASTQLECQVYSQERKAEVAEIRAMALRIQADPPRELIAAGSTLRRTDYLGDLMTAQPYTLDATGYQTVIQIAASVGRPGNPAVTDLTKLLLLKKIAGLSSEITDTCEDVRTNIELLVKLNQLHLAVRKFMLQIYRDPSKAELVFRIQASRGNLFELMREVVAGDSDALAELSRISDLVAADSVAAQAVRLFDAFDRLRSEAYAQAKAGDADAARAFIMLSPENHNGDLVRRYRSALAQKKSMDLLQETAAFLSILVPALQGSAAATRRDVQKSEACGSSDPNQLVSEQIRVSNCKIEWDKQHPVR
jgi:hypothetical protein